MSEFRLPSPDPTHYAKRLILAKFGGLFPSSMTAMELIELMVEFSKFESERANEYQRIAEDLVALRLPAPIITKRL